MSSIVKDNSNNRIRKFIEDFKNFSSILVGRASVDSKELSLEDYAEENSDIIEELKNSSMKIDRTAKLYESSIGLPSKSTKSKVSKNTSVKDTKTIINPIISDINNNNNNISMFRNDDFLR